MSRRRNRRTRRRRQLRERRRNRRNGSRRNRRNRRRGKRRLTEADLTDDQIDALVEVVNELANDFVYEQLAEYGEMGNLVIKALRKEGLDASPDTQIDLSQELTLNNEAVIIERR